MWIFKNIYVKVLNWFLNASFSGTSCIWVSFVASYKVDKQVSFRKVFHKARKVTGKQVEDTEVQQTLVCKEVVDTAVLVDTVDKFFFFYRNNYDYL